MDPFRFVNPWNDVHLRQFLQLGRNLKLDCDWDRPQFLGYWNGIFREMNLVLEVWDETNICREELWELQFDGVSRHRHDSYFHVVPIELRFSFLQL